MLKLIALSTLGVLVIAGVAAAADKEKTDIDYKVKTIKGKEVDLAEKYKGKVLLVVNVASKCGLTPHYTPLEALHEKYADKGLAVLGFPCNQFGGQEPGTEAEIEEFCSETYKVKFDLFSKVDVNGDKADPLYKHLTAVKSEPKANDEDAPPAKHKDTDDSDKRVKAGGGSDKPKPEKSNDGLGQGSSGLSGGSGGGKKGDENASSGPGGSSGSGNGDQGPSHEAPGKDKGGKGKK